MNAALREWMIDKRCEPQMWRREWDANGQRPEWEDLTDNYKQFIQYQQGYPGETRAKEWWNARYLREKREYFDPLPTPQQIKKFSTGNPYSTNRHVGLDLQAELDDARAEIKDLTDQNIRLSSNVRGLHDSLRRQREHYLIEIEQYEKIIAEKRQQITDLKLDLKKQRAYYGEQLKRIGMLDEVPPPPPPSSLNQQAAQTNPYRIA